jgi:glycosyltransferase involved in cell wall biosynthesis
MWNGKKISVVIPAYNEESTIREIVEEVYGAAPVDEVIVVNNNSTDGTLAEARKTKATVVREERRGYGFALRKGVEEASGDYIVFFDADGNFAADDIMKLLSYTDCFDFVKGTRSRRELVEEGTYHPLLSWLVIIANVIVAKFQQSMFRGPVMTDAGCTLRLIKREVVRRIWPFITVGGAHFQTDITNLAMITQVRMVEVPVRFTKRRGGYSKHGAFAGLSKIAVRMIAHTIKQRILSWLGHYNPVHRRGEDAPHADTNIVL